MSTCKLTGRKTRKIEDAIKSAFKRLNDLVNKYDKIHSSCLSTIYLEQIQKDLSHQNPNYFQYKLIRKKNINEKIKNYYFEEKNVTATKNISD